MAVFGIILLVVIAIFAWQNPTVVTIRFIGWQYEAALGRAMIAAALAGAILIYVTSLFRARQEWNLRTRVKGVETRLREVEQQRQDAGDEPQPGSGS